MYGLRNIPARLKMHLEGLRLRAAEALLPCSYFVQMRPRYVGQQWDSDRKKYDRLHDWSNFRDGVRVLQAHLMLDLVKGCQAGDYAEVGTYRGNYARLIYSRMAGSASLYCFDTFSGFPESATKQEKATTGLAVATHTFSDTSEQLVLRNIVGQSDGSRLHLRKGEFPVTFAGLEDRNWRFVLLDADLYAPIKAGLELFWPGIVPGGVILVHDYIGAYPGVKKAVEEFFDPLGIVPIPWPDRVGTAVIVKQPCPK